ncbi:MAG: hypothetical protein AAGD34_05795, partial [Pseudomonadota bacterium]
VMALVAFYALHHGLAKGALFLSVGVVDHTAAHHRKLILAFIALIALSVAGLPFSGGAAVKAALKSLFDGPAGLAVTASATGTALILARFWFALRARPAETAAARAETRLTLPVYACGIAALLVPWALLPLVGLQPGYINTPSNLWSTAWPVLLAGVIAFAAYTLRPAPLPIPPGDLIAVFARLGRIPRPRFPVPPSPHLFTTRVDIGLERVERAVLKWNVAGGLLLGLVLGCVVLLL